MTKILFVCSANKDRSRTADHYFSELYPELEFDSAGTNLKLCEKLGTNPLREEMLVWADLVLVMEEKHRKLIKEHTEGKYGAKIRVLGIPDRFKYFQKELIEVLERKVEGVF
ncbi:MAG: phosphotyrosine protein phosphatase [Bacteroidia bacterium]|nr:phosphotyrosine protein phosphatase [Bacteroidia bacterium]